MSNSGLPGSSWNSPGKNTTPKGTIVRLSVLITQPQGVPFTQTAMSTVSSELHNGSHVHRDSLTVRHSSPAFLALNLKHSQNILPNSPKGRERRTNPTLTSPLQGHKWAASLTFQLDDLGHIIINLFLCESGALTKASREPGYLRVHFLQSFPFPIEGWNYSDGKSPVQDHWMCQQQSRSSVASQGLI